MKEARTLYDCDTTPYWCSDEEYNNREKTFGHFSQTGDAYVITDNRTPRPWLNYFCNKKFASCFSNTGLGFTWYKSSLLRVTKYEHPIDYLPRDFEDGRDVCITDVETGEQCNVFREARDIQCTHYFGYSSIETVWQGLKISLTVFVPTDDSGECWKVVVTNTEERSRSIAVDLKQVWTFSKFGIHTAEEGIPYLSTPGKDLAVRVEDSGVFAHSSNSELPFDMYGIFTSPQAVAASCLDEIVEKSDGRTFTFKKCSLNFKLQLSSGESHIVDLFSGAEEDAEESARLENKYSSSDVFPVEFSRMKEQKGVYRERLKCDIPDISLQHFLNVWLKNQLYLTFHFVRSGYVGYRDTLQDTWGYTLLDTDASRAQLLRTLSHMMQSGACPRNYSPVDDKHDLREFMDSGTWIPLTLCDYIKETGDVDILTTHIPYLDSSSDESVEEHVWRALDFLYNKRGVHGICLTGDGDWNDALEGISKCGDAESVWLTIALYYAQNCMAELYEEIGFTEKRDLLQKRSDELKNICREVAWDGEWYIYGFTGSGAPIGSHTNKEGRIHLNVQTWAIFTGLATADQCIQIQQSIQKYLDTPLGPVLMSPPYAEEAAEVGRIANLEPGTFENASIYQHAVAFKLLADCALHDAESAHRGFANLLPTNPDNFDCRRTSEPYAMGNYYCGPDHPRFGQNFFTWFTGNPAWLLRIGYDYMLGIKPEYNGVRIAPLIPQSWQRYRVSRMIRGVQYDVSITRGEDTGVWVDGEKLSEMYIPYQLTEGNDLVSVHVIIEK
jgi:cellobiose phosphorylase